ncbi:zinc finger protein 271-like isoform X4 [Vespula squamosa]|uniref:Zinc finger protein 271-like isoform X4 n=1 Tax=Vespula squamosa TaxID=30214 RepID=A0ABD2AIQ2_VESSQ
MVDEQNFNVTSENLLKSYSCHLCSKVFKMRGSLMIHMRVAHIGHNWGFLSKDGDASMGINNNGYNCPTCGKNFKKVSQRTHKCPVQQSSAQQQSNEIIQTSAVTSIAQENCNEANHLQETNSSQQIKQILNGINNKDNKFVLIINAQGQTVLTRESDLENEQEANFTKTKETNKNSSEDEWNSDSSKNFNSKSSTNHSDKLLSDNRNDVQDTTDFFSLVMSPLENDLSSPTSGMEHLRLSSPISKNISQPLFSNFRHPSENINENIIHTDVEETYTTDDNIRCSFETINEESLKQLLYSIDKK